SEFSALVDRPTKYTRFSVILGLILSGIFNCLAFTYNAHTALYIGIGVVLGVLVPTSLYALTQTSHILRRRNPQVLRATKRKTPANPRKSEDGARLTVLRSSNGS
ncbi:MAG: hypothetical protein MN733_31320, partial [Nitrososphaera sp.]|nr:hypothetical protein [Nitrososphaera sp.]